MVDFVCECILCGHKDYRFNAPQQQMVILSSCSEKKLFTCYHCHANGSNMKVRQLKWKDIQLLHKKFPNKKAIFTTLTVEDLLKLEDDLSPNPNLEDREDEEKMKKGDFINMYNSHTKEGKPDEDTLYAKGVLLKRYKSKTMEESWKKAGFESWTVIVFWDKLGNPPHLQQLWFVHPNDIIDVNTQSKGHWIHYMKQMKKVADSILKIIGD